MEQDSHSSEHPGLERISAFLDDPGDDPEAAEHLRTCERCEREQERMRRMRMALSALDEVTPPEGEWEQIEPHLPDGGGAGERSRGVDGALPLPWSRWAPRVAAATLVFAVGLGAGLQLRGGGWTGGGDGASGPTAAAAGGDGDRTDAGAAAAASPGDASSAGLAASGEGAPGPLRRAGDYLSAARDLESLVDRGAGSAMEPVDDPVAAAEEMARLEALAEAAREALHEQPADPALNNFLFRVSERQEALRSRLGAAAHLAAMDYR